jgi:hypothetical protein
MCTRLDHVFEHLKQRHRLIFWRIFEIPSGLGHLRRNFSRSPDRAAIQRTGSGSHGAPHGPSATEKHSLRQTLKGRVTPVVVGAAVVVGGANMASYAAGGHPLRLGVRSHETHATTVVDDQHGPAFRFKTSAGVAPSA